MPRKSDLVVERRRLMADMLADVAAGVMLGEYVLGSSCEEKHSDISRQTGHSANRPLFSFLYIEQ